MLRLLLLVLGVALSLCVAPQSRAQNSATAHQHPSGPPMIDGAAHPELIPDAFAYRLYLVAVSTSASPTDVQRRSQQVHLAKTGLSAGDRETLTVILADFRSRFDLLVAQYNDSAKAALAHNEMADIRGLLKSLDELVQSTRDAINVRLSSEGAARLHFFVLSEKKNMKVQSED